MKLWPLVILFVMFSHLVGSHLAGDRYSWQLIFLFGQSVGGQFTCTIYIWSRINIVISWREGRGAPISVNFVFYVPCSLGFLVLIDFVLNLSNLRPHLFRMPTTENICLNNYHNFVIFGVLILFFNVLKIKQSYYLAHNIVI